MTLAERAEAYATAFPEWLASWPRIVQEDGRDVLYATWVIGNDYRNKTAYYGAYPKGYLERVMALFPDVDSGMRRLVLGGARHGGVLHVFSGSLPPGPYRRLDIRVDAQPDHVGSVYDAPSIFAGEAFGLVIVVLRAEDGDSHTARGEA